MRGRVTEVHPIALRLTYLHGDEVLFLGIACTVDVGHPVAGVTSAIDEVTQFAVVEHLPDKNHPMINSQ